MTEMTSENTSTAHNVAIVIRSLAAFMVILSLSLWPAPDGAMADGQPFSSLGSFLLYRYQTLAVGLLAIGIAVCAFFVARTHFARTAQIHAREMAIAEERYRREMEYRENLELVTRMERTRKDTKEVADLARAVAGELSTCVNDLWIRIEVIHNGLAQSGNGISDEGHDHNGSAPKDTIVDTGAGYAKPVIFHMVADRLGFLGWDLAAEVTTFHSRSESISKASFGRNDFKPAPDSQGVAMLRHALHGAILQNRIQAIAHQIDSGQQSNFATSVDTQALDAQALGDLHKHFGVRENGEINAERWEHFASADAGESGVPVMNELLPTGVLSEKQDPRKQAML